MCLQATIAELQRNLCRHLLDVVELAPKRRRHRVALAHIRMTARESIDVQDGGQGLRPLHFAFPPERVAVVLRHHITIAHLTFARSIGIHDGVHTHVIIATAYHQQQRGEQQAETNLFHTFAF